MNLVAVVPRTWWTRFGCPCRLTQSKRRPQAVRFTAELGLTMQEQLKGSDKDEPEDAKGPSQDNGVRAGIR